MVLTSERVAQGTLTIAFVVAIEGYEYLLTSYPDRDAVLTSWSGSEWTQCLGGLHYAGNLDSEIVPWESKFDEQVLSLKVDNETFGAAVFKTHPADGIRTHILSTLSAADEDFFVYSVTGLSPGQTIYIGNERITIGTISGKQLVGCSRGLYSPFPRQNDLPLGRRHVVDSITFGAQVQPKVTTYRKDWAGARIGVWAHHVNSDGSLNTKAEAQLIFSGTINDIDSTAEGGTIVTCANTMTQLNRTVLLQDQFTGRVKEGIYLSAANYPAGAGDPISQLVSQIRVSEKRTSSGNTKKAKAFRAVVSGATQKWEINEGFYTLDVLLGKLNAWLANEKSAGRLDMIWSVGRVPTDKNRIRFRARGSISTGFLVAKLEIYPWGLSQALGDDPAHSFPYDKYSSPDGSSIDISFEMPSAAYRISPGGGADGSWELQFESSYGSWCLTPTAFLPQPWRQQFVSTPSTGNPLNFGEYAPDIYEQENIDGSPSSLGQMYGFFSINDEVFFGRFRGNRIDKIQFTLEDRKALLALGAETNPLSPRLPHLLQGEEGDLIVKQIILMQGSQKDILARLMLSTGSSNYNANPYDAWSGGISARMPWSLFGDEFINSLTRLGQSSATSLMTILIPKPTAFDEMFKSQLALYDAHLIFKNGKHVIVSATPQPTHPSNIPSGDTDWNFTESNKATLVQNTSAGQAEIDRSSASKSTEFVRNVIKVNYGRKLDGKYSDVREVVNGSSVAAMGELPVTINAPNLLGITDDQDEIAEAIISSLAARALVHYGHPILLVERSINYTLALAAPGDRIRFTDSFVRNPRTGEHGISNWLAWIHRHSFDWSVGVGRVTIAIPSPDTSRKGAPIGPAVVLDRSYNEESTQGPDVPQDGPNDWYTPLGSSDFAELALATPGNLWLCTETSGDLSPTIGALTLVDQGTGHLYQQAIDDWDRDAVGSTSDGVQCAWRATSGGPDPSSNSVAWIGYFRFPSLPAASRVILAVSQGGGATVSLTLVLRTTGVLRIDCCNVNSDGTYNYVDGNVHPIALVYNRTAGTVKVYTDQETITGTYNSGVVSDTCGIGHVAGSTTGIYRCLWLASYEGTDAELDWDEYLDVLTTSATISQRRFPINSSHWQGVFPAITTPTHIWGFQEPSSPIIDLAGGGADLVQNQSLLYQQTGDPEPTTDPRYSIKFDNTNANEWLGPVNHTYADPGSSSMSIYLRFMLPFQSSGTTRTLVSKVDSGGAGWQLRVLSGNDLQFVVSDAALDSTNVRIITPDIDDGEWHDALAVIDRANDRITLTCDIGNASPDSLSGSSIDAITTADGLRFGSSAAANTVSGTQISYAALWNGTALASGTIDTIRAAYTPTFVAGYNYETRTLRYDEIFAAEGGASDANDFDIGDIVRWLEQAPSGATAHSQQATIVEIDRVNRFITLDGIFPASGTNTNVVNYYLMPDSYWSVTESQQYGTYLASSGTYDLGLNDYGFEWQYNPVTTSGTTVASGTAGRFEYSSSFMTASGSPVTPAQNFMLCNNVNNLVGYRLLNQQASPTNTGSTEDNFGDDAGNAYYLFSPQIKYTGPTIPPPGYQYKMYVKPVYQVETPSKTFQIRTTLSPKLPISDTTVSGAGQKSVVFQEPFQQCTFPLTSGTTQVVNISASGIPIPWTGPTGYLFTEYYSNVASDAVTWFGYSECDVRLEPIDE